MYIFYIILHSYIFLEMVVKGPSTKGSTYGLKSFHRLIDDKCPFHGKKIKNFIKTTTFLDTIANQHFHNTVKLWNIVILTQFCSILYLLMSIWVNIWIISAVRTKFCPRIYMREWEEVTKNWVTHFFIWP